MNANVDGSYAGKRVFDLTVLAIASVPAVAIGTVTALAIKATSPGPAFFKQERVGRNGRHFDVWKFRTMIHATDNPLFPEPASITRAGRWLRRLSLDELPQLINVMTGEMSIVGPRPTLPYQVARYDERQRRRLAICPGMTGLAQERGRNSIAWAERIEYDLEYVERQSVILDMKVLWWTVAAVARGFGVGGHPTDDPLAAPPGGDQG